MNLSFPGNETYQAEWVIKGTLACSQRPGYPVNRPALETVREWVDIALGMGVQSVICVLDDTQVSYYDSLNLDGGGLLGYYESLGLAVEHVQAEDYKTPPLSSEQLDAVWRAFQRLDKPVLIHCSAGRDRTGAAVANILSRLEQRNTC